MEYLEYLKQAHVANIIQAISSTVLVFITAFYAFLTKNILHAPYQSYLRPIKIDIVFYENSGWSFQVRNFGPSIAININIYAVAITKSTYCRVANNYYNEIKKIISTGPLEILSESEGVYTFTGFIDFKFPIIIKWQSINGKKQKSSWLISTEDDRAMVAPLPKYKKIIFGLKWLRIIISSPFVLIKKKYYKHFKGEKHL